MCRNGRPRGGIAAAPTSGIVAAPTSAGSTPSSFAGLLIAKRRILQERGLRPLHIYGAQPGLFATIRRAIDLIAHRAAIVVRS